MSFQQALSGLNAAGKNLDVIGNNVANANTVGFKGARAEFADVYAATALGTTSGRATGIGTQVTGVTQLFTQGNVSVTDRPYDVAISGDGFFRLDDNGSIVYTRNGQFHRDDDGYLVNAAGLHLTGYGVDADGQVNTSRPLPLQLTVNSIEARATQRAAQGSVLDSRSDAVVDGNGDPIPFDPDDSGTYTHATSMEIYDSLGNSHLLSTYYVKRGPGTWDVYASFDNDDGLLPSPLTTLTFDGNGRLAPSSTSQIPITVATADLNNGANPLSFVYDLTPTSQTGQPFSNESQDQDGFTSGRLTSFSIGDDGTIVANYSNFQSRAQGQIALASFNSPEGLHPIGNNNYVETGSSGIPRLGGPGTSDFGTVRAGALEDSNIDLTAELVNMITAQRVYQANAQTIKTQDSIMQTLVSMR